jgi:hypothetical protein
MVCAKVGQLLTLTLYWETQATAPPRLDLSRVAEQHKAPVLKTLHRYMFSFALVVPRLEKRAFLRDHYCVRSALSCLALSSSLANG